MMYRDHQLGQLDALPLQKEISDARTTGSALCRAPATALRDAVDS